MVLCPRASLRGSFAFDAMFEDPGVFLYFSEGNALFGVEYK